MSETAPIYKTKRQTPHPIMPDLEDFYTTQEAAEKLGFTLQGVSRMIRQKRLSAVRFGKSWFVYKKSVAEYLIKTEGMSKNDPRRKADK